VKVLGINGSPRRDGNTQILLDKALEGAASGGAEIERIDLDRLTFGPCREEEYYAVDDRGFSVIEDDMHQVYREVEACDALILASPIFFGGLSAQMKAMIDRFQCVWVSKFMLNRRMFIRRKAGAFISVEASNREDFFQNAKAIIRNFFALINVRYTGELFCPGMEEKGAVLASPEKIERAVTLGVNLAAK
jgi:multimeric flavodoxin WrbA